MRLFQPWHVLLALAPFLYGGASCIKNEHPAPGDSTACKPCSNELVRFPLSPEQLSTAAAPDGENVLANLVDGSTGTRWSGQGDPQSVTIKLDSIRAVGAVRIAFHTGGSTTRTSSFEIAVSADSSNWTTVVPVRNSDPNTTTLQTFGFPSTCTRYVRITGHGNSQSNWNSYTEVEVWGCGNSTETEGKIDLTGDWETGDGSQWDDGWSGKDSAAQFEIVTSPKRQGNYAAKFTVRPGDRACKNGNCTSGERMEMNRWNYVRETVGDEYYYGWSTMFPEDWQQPEGWAIFMQWHAHTPISPPLAFGVKDNNVRVEFSSGDIGEWWPAEYQQNHNIAQLNKGKWHDFIVRVRFKPDSTGLLEVWHRLEGQAEFSQVLSLPKVPTLQWSNEPDDVSENYRIPYTRSDLGAGYTSGLYVKHGLYRGIDSLKTSTLYQDNWHRGTSFKAIRATFN
ncbi:heparin lyase I family protein [Chitinophaga sp.]|uniref:heparin lyase I family protein n=1 Tax=Chitinophaga sp. TaxID=1869181 RepID=UPI00260C447D|nr:heparin lyase I family protein [uncultured Chitinophaga sp.]